MNQFLSFTAASVRTELSKNAPGFELHPADKLHETLQKLHKNPTEMYYSQFAFDAKTVATISTLKGYKGIHGLSLGVLALDFDSKENISAALNDAKKFIKDFALPDSSYALFESGSKGFHLCLAESAFGTLLAPSDSISTQIKRLAESLKPEYATLDTSIYDTVRKFRAPGSVHPATNKLKTLVGGSWPLGLVARNEALESRFIAANIVSENAPDYGSGSDDAILEFTKLFNDTRDKPCVAGILAAPGKYGPGKRHEPFLTMVSVLLHSGHTYSQTKDKLRAWMLQNNSEERAQELEAHYRDFTAGKLTLPKCKRPVLSEHCKDTCPVWPRLSQETRDSRPWAWTPESEKVEPEAEEQSNEEPKKGAKNKSETPKKTTPGELAIVTNVLAELNERCVMQEEDLFVYNGKYWEHMEPPVATRHLKKLVDHAAKRKYRTKDINSAYARLLLYIPRVPAGVNMFFPNPYRQNFKDGCLHITRAFDGTYSLELKPHNKLDYLITCHDFDYAGQESRPLNEDFEKMLSAAWAGRDDEEQQRNAYLEALGSGLVPTFPKVFLFLGQPGTGKSTLISFITQLVDQRFRCSVGPTEMYGFNTHSMAGKLLNYDTDINTQRPVSDAILKKIEDRIPIRIERKKMTDLYAPLPPLHVFGANKLPESKEGAAVYQRRAIILRCENVVTEGERYVQDYGNMVWKKNPEGIVRRAIEGLQRLAAQKGHFTKPASSHDTIKEWGERSNDTVQDFLESVALEPVFNTSDELGQGSVDFRYPVKQKDAWKAYKIWMLANTLNAASMRGCPSKTAFYRRIKELGIPHKTFDGYEHFCIGSAKWD